MKIQTVTVEIHEKRNNPNAYGHYDSRIVYTAEIDEGEVPEQVVERLQFIARQQVATECDRWEAEVKREEERTNARSNLNWIIERAANNAFVDRDAMQFEENLRPLLVDEQTEYRAKLDVARQNYIEILRKQLDGWIQKAEAQTLSDAGLRRFREDIDDLPENERKVYHARMEAALVSEVGVTIDEEDDIKF